LNPQNLNQTIYTKRFKIITNVKQLFDVVRTYKFISIIDQKSVAKSFNKSQSFQAMRIKPYDIRLIDNKIFLLTLNNYYSLTSNFLIAELSPDNLVIISNTISEKFDITV